MDLCTTLIKDELSVPSIVLHPEEVPCIKRYDFFQQGVSLKQGAITIAHAHDIPENIAFETGAALMCIGDPSRMSIHKRLPVIILTDEVDIFTLANELGLLFQKYNMLEAQLNILLQEGHSLQEMVELMCPFFGNELTVADAGHRIQAHAYVENDSHKEFAYRSFEGKDMVPLDIIGFFTNNKRWVEVKTETEPFIYDEGVFGYQLLCINIMGEHSFAWRVMLADTDQPFRPYDVQLLQFFTAYVARAFEGYLATRTTQKMDSLKDVLGEMLLGRQVESWRVNHALSVAGHAKESAFLCVCIRPWYWDDSVGSLTYFCNQLWTLFPGIISLEFKGDIVGLVEMESYGSTEKFTEIVAPFIRDNNFRVGISEPFENVMYFQNHYMQADIALTFGIKEEPSIWVHRFQDQAVGYMIRRVGEEVGVRTLCSSCVVALYDYDVKNGSDYLETMECFFKNHLNISKTAHVLNIHRATMIYRLNRIEELSGIDFRNAEKNLYYQLSIKLLRLMVE